MNFTLKDIIKISGSEYASLADDGIEGTDVTNYIDTGSYILNALLSGSIYKGLAGNKITAFAGQSSTGKCARGCETIEVYVSPDTAKDIEERIKKD